jgi:hypothetical protein
VARLGEFSPKGRLFFQISKVSNIFGLLFSRAEVMPQYCQKMYLAAFWAIFAQTHLVTLVARLSEKQIVEVSLLL